MNHKIYTFDEQATFVCPNCNKTKTINIAKFKKTKRVVKVNLKCSCGHSLETLLERRNYRRKETTLPGIFSRPIERSGVERGNIVIMDISRAGLKFKSHVRAEFNIGDKLLIDFHLNDKEKSFIKKEAIIKNICRDDMIGAQFCATDFYGKIGEYIFS